MADTLIPGLNPVLGPDLGDTIFEAPGRIVEDEDNLLTLNLGPQHPSTHGVFRLIMQLQGETVIGSTPVMGYLHRSSEKLGEARTYVQGTVLTDRMDYLSPVTTNWAYALAIERLTGLVVPERAEFLRLMTGELSRIQSHLVAVGTFGADVGTYFTPLLYTLREREAILDLLALDVARAYSVTGPILRASGVPYDVRRSEPYSVYDRFDWDVPVRYNGDCFDRYMIRVQEMRQSTRILQQALDSIPEGDIRAKLPKVLKPPKGEAYARIEGPKGEIGFYLISDGSPNPYRYNVRPPSFVNLTCLSQIAVGHKLADAVVILGSFDIVMGEVDR